mmetsp:Transcript_49254/g.86702  ORF Transcript_49254/g.86702 Transcript_49254/m.86702 type:complete len:266 (+) Transcript_49254:110-907(+)
MPEFMTRRLYDSEWMEAGCNGTFPPGTNTDDTFGCYASDYLIAVVCLLGAMAIATKADASKWFKILVAGKFVFDGLGFGLAGLLHQIFHEDEDHMEHVLLWKISYTATLLGSLLLGLLVSKYLSDKFDSFFGYCQAYLNTTVVIVIGAVILQTATEPKLILTGAASGVLALYGVVVFAIRCQWLSVAGLVTMLVGFLVQIVLAPKCGDNAYLDCFRDCPLPAPDFNHNALFHCIYAVGVALLAIDWRCNPLLEPKEDSEEAEPIP